MGGLVLMPSTGGLFGLQDIRANANVPFPMSTSVEWLETLEKQVKE